MTNDVMMFIDGSYVVKSTDFKIDYKKLKTFLEKEIGKTINQGVYFNSVSKSGAEEQNKFHNFLKSAAPVGPRLEVKLYAMKGSEIRCHNCQETFVRQVQKGVDVAIATKMIEQAYLKKCSTILLVAGDGDFEDAVHFLRSHLDQKIILAGFRKTMSVDIQSICDRVIFLEDHANKIKK